MDADEMNDKMIKTRDKCTEKLQLKMSSSAVGALAESGARTIPSSYTPVEETTPWKRVSSLLYSFLACSRAQLTCNGSQCGWENVVVSG